MLQLSQEHQWQARTLNQLLSPVCRRVSVLSARVCVCVVAADVICGFILYP